MARGKSGRVVLEIDPELKRHLYLALEQKQQTMKEWFVKEAESLVYASEQPSLFNSDNNLNKSEVEEGTKDEFQNK